MMKWKNTILIKKACTFVLPVVKEILLFLCLSRTPQDLSLKALSDLFIAKSVIFDEAL